MFYRLLLGDLPADVSELLLNLLLVATVLLVLDEHFILFIIPP